MSNVTVRISSTIGATGLAGTWVREAGPETAIGWGHVVGTLCPDGDEAEALVVMHEPALAGVDVIAEPVAVLHLAGDPDREELLCVADDPTLADLVQDERILPADGPMLPWATALSRLSARPTDVRGPCGSRADAEHLLDEERDAYLRSTGCLDQLASPRPSSTTGTAAGHPRNSRQTTREPWAMPLPGPGRTCLTARRRWIPPGRWTSEPPFG